MFYSIASMIVSPNNGYKRQDKKELNPSFTLEFYQLQYAMNIVTSFTILGQTTNFLT